MSLNDDYLVLARENNDSYPLVTWVNYHREFMLPEPVVEQPPVRLRISDPVPHNPQFVDYHEGSIRIVSEKVKLALGGIVGVQLVPATFETGKIKLPYYILHSWKRIKCTDRLKSDCDFDEYGDISEVRRLALSEPILAPIPLEDRMIFLLGELPSTRMFHKSVVEKVLATNPVGLRFLSLLTWDSNSDFN